jgi:Ca2+-binding EF-hand superfamily protein
MRPQVFAVAVALALPLAGSGMATTADAQGNRQAQGNRMRFAAMDANSDGRITREEWRGSDTSFKVHDWNGDGVLSGNEVRVGAQRRNVEDDYQPDRLVLRDWSPARFSSIDRNRDGRIARAEWFYDAEGFMRADRNRDNILSRAEFLGGDIDDDREEAFADLDVNRNGRIERNEWHGSRDAFEWMDRNNDGTLSRVEVAGEEAAPAAPTDLFTSLDANRNGVVDRSEWQWSRVSFNGRDRNNDGVLSRSELGTAAAGSSPVLESDATGTAGRTIVVSARERWTDTGIMVNRGDLLSFQSDGSIRLSRDGGDAASPTGSASGRRAANAPVNTHPAGGLIARIGNSAPVYVGDRTSRLRAPSAGRLFLSVNDDHLEDNSGHFNVTIVVQR